MKVKIKVNCPGSEDGCKILHFEAGKEYDITDKLANSFIKRGKAIDSNSIVEEAKEIEEEIIVPKEEVIMEVIEEDKEEVVLKEELLEEPKEIEEEKEKEENKNVKLKIEEEKSKTKMFNSYENKAIQSSPKNKRKIIKKIKLKKGKK